MIAALAAALSVMAVPAAALTPGSLGTSQSPQGEPRYTVKVTAFWAIDESGYDFSGSDEVFGIFDSTRGHSTGTRVYGNVDSGDLVNFDRLEKCLTSQRVLSGSALGGLRAPGDTWECDPRGAAAPIGLKLELWEDDICSPFAIPACFDQWNGGAIDSADDLIGRVQPTYTAAQLAMRLPNVGDYTVDRFTLGGPCGHQEPGGSVCGHGAFSSTGPEYRLSVIIRRVSDAPLRASE